MKSVAQTLTAALAVIAIALPSVSAAVPASRNAEQPAAAGDRSALIAERQQRTWHRLSGSICTGCITAANRIAPVSYDKPSLIALAQSSPRLQTVSQRPRAKVRFAQMQRAKVRFAKLRFAKLRFAKLQRAEARTREAWLQRRDRRRIAMRTQSVRIAKRLHRRIAALHRVAPAAGRMTRPVARDVVQQVTSSITWPIGLIGVEDRLRERRGEQPWVPQDDNRWHTTILPTATMRSRRS